MTTNTTNYILAGQVATVAGLGAAVVQVCKLPWLWQITCGVLVLGVCALAFLALGLANSFGSPQLRAWLDGPALVSVQQRELQLFQRAAGEVETLAEVAMLLVGALTLAGLLAYVALR